MIAEVHNLLLNNFIKWKKISSAANYYREEAETASLVGQCLMSICYRRLIIIFRLCIRLY